MTATALSFTDWQASVMDDLHRQITALATATARVDPGSRLHCYVSAAMAAFLEGDVDEVERLLDEAAEWLRRCDIELEWRAAGIIHSKWRQRR